MLQSYLVRGLKVGLAAGLFFGVFVALVANPVIGLAEGLAGDHDHDHGHAEGDHHGTEAAHDHGESGLLGSVSTASTSVVAGVFWGLLLGVVAFGAVFFFLEPAIPGAGDTKSYLLAAAGFVTVSGAPWLVLPPQPPGAAQALSPETGALWYGGMMVAGALACGSAGYLFNRLRARGRVVAAGAAALPLAALAVVPLVAPVPGAEQALPDALVTAYRGLVVLSQATLWLVLGATHAWLLRRETSADEDLLTEEYDQAVTAD